MYFSKKVCVAVSSVVCFLIHPPSTIITIGDNGATVNRAIAINSRSAESDSNGEPLDSAGVGYDTVSITAVGAMIAIGVVAMLVRASKSARRQEQQQQVDGTPGEEGEKVGGDQTESVRATILAYNSLASP